MSLSQPQKEQDSQQNFNSKQNLSSEQVIQKIIHQAPVFKIVKDKSPEMTKINSALIANAEKIREDIQKQALQLVFKGPNAALKPEEQGQAELRMVLSMLEKQLKQVETNPAKFAKFNI